ATHERHRRLSGGASPYIRRSRSGTTLRPHGSATAAPDAALFQIELQSPLAAAMDSSTVAALALLFALGAALYSSVGHGGASAYIAAMALFSVAPETMKPTALALNLLVAGFGAWRYWRRGLTNWRLVLTFALTATPVAYIGGWIHLPEIYYKPLVGVLLCDAT